MRSPGSARIQLCYGLEGLGQRKVRVREAAQTFEHFGRPLSGGEGYGCVPGRDPKAAGTLPCSGSAGRSTTRSAPHWAFIVSSAASRDSTKKATCLWSRVWAIPICKVVRARAYRIVFVGTVGGTCKEGRSEEGASCQGQRFTPEVFAIAWTNSRPSFRARL